LVLGDDDYVRVGKVVNGYESATDSRWAYQFAGIQEKLVYNYKQHQLEAGARLHYENYHDINIKNDSTRWASSGTTIADLYYYLIAPSAYIKNDFNFGNLQITPIARFELLYLTKNDLLKNSNTGANNGPNYGDIKNNFNELTPGINIIYRDISLAKTQIEIYASAYRGYSSPTTAIAFVTVENGEVVPTTGDETNMKPETSINSELGSRFVQRNQVYNGQVAVFNMDINNFYSPARAQAFETLGSVRISGLEFAFNMNISKALHIANHEFSFGTALTIMQSEITSGSLSDNDLFTNVIHTTATQNELINKINTTPDAYEIYVDGVIYTGEVTPEIFDDISKLVVTYGDGKAEGYDVPYVPAIIANANLNYKFKNFSSDISINYTGEQYTEFYSFENESADGSIGKLPAYYYLNGNLNYTLKTQGKKIEKATFFVAGKNLTNQIYRSSRLNRATGGLFPYGFIQVNAGIRLSF
jgi:Fe(3+) dicitrate transport protein